MPTDFLDTFDADPIGALSPTWTQDTAGVWTVQDGTAVGFTGRAHRAAQGAADDWAYRPCTRRTTADGLVTISGVNRTGSTLASGNNRWGVTNFEDTTTGRLVAGISWIGANCFLLNTTVNTSLFVPAVNTVYAWAVTIDFAAGKVTKVVINGTTYDNGGAGWGLWTNGGAGVATGVNRIKTSRFSPTVTAGEFVWVDAVSVATSVTNDTPSGSVQVTGAANDSHIVGGPTAGTLHISGTHGGVVCGPNKLGQVVMVYEEGGARPVIDSLLPERSATAGASWGDASAEFSTATALGPAGPGRLWKIVDRRPQFGNQSATWGAAIRYRVTPKLSGNVGDVTAATADVNPDVSQAAVRAAHFQKLRDYIDAQPGGYVPSSTTGVVYVGEIVLDLAWAYYLEGNAGDLTRLDAEFDYIKTLCNADNLLQFPGLTSLIYIDHHGRTAMHLALASRLLQLAGESTNSNALLTQADLMAKAIFLKLNSGSPEVTKATVGFQVGAFAARANSTAYSLGAIRRANPDNGCTYRVIQTGVSAAAQPAMSTTELDTVTDGTVIWRVETGLRPIERGTDYVVGDIGRPAIANGHTYRGTFTGTTHATTEPSMPTAAGATVTDGTVVWTETSVTDTILYHEFDPTAPYGWQTNSVVDTNQQSEQAFLLAMLMTDARSATFYPAGVYRTRAQDVVDGISGVLTAYQGSGGRIAIGDPSLLAGGNTDPGLFDTLYGGFTAFTWAGIKALLGDRHPQMTAWLSRGLDWLEDGYSDESATPGGILGVHYTGYWVLGGPYELMYRNVGLALLARTSTTDKIPYSGAFWDEPTGRWGGYNAPGAVTPLDQLYQAVWSEAPAFMAAISLGPTYADTPAPTVDVTGDAADDYQPPGLPPDFSDEPAGTVTVTGVADDEWGIAGGTDPDPAPAVSCPTPADRALALLQHLAVDPQSAQVLDALVRGWMDLLIRAGLIAYGCDVAGLRPWQAITDPAAAPDWALPYTAQWTGGTMPVRLPGEPDATYIARARADLILPKGMRRGSTAAVVAAAKATLTGSKLLLFREQDGSAWHVTARTRTAETPEPALTEAVIAAQLSAGVTLDYLATDFRDWAELADTYATWADVAAANADWADALTP